MEPKKIARWIELVQKLKELPSFGIHGAQAKNLEAILRDIKEGKGLFGHYFGASGEDKKLPDNKFYQRLYSSVHVAKNFSRAYSSDGKTMVSSSDVLLILGMSNKVENEVEYSQQTNAHTLYGKTLSIGHDMGEFFNFYPIIMPRQELENINAEAESLKPKWSGYPCPALCFDFFTNERIIWSLLEKLGSALKILQ